MSYVTEEIYTNGLADVRRLCAWKAQVKAGGHELTGGLALHPPAANAPAATSIFALGLLVVCWFATGLIRAPSYC